MHILLCFAHPHLPDIRGGLQTSTDELCQVLQEKGVEVTVLCGSLPEDGDRPASRDMSLGYPVIRAVDPVAALPLVAAAASPSVILVQSSRRIAPLLKAAYGTGFPVAAYFHDVEQHDVHGILVPDPRILYFANSRFTADRWKALYGLDCHVLQPMVLPGKYLARRTGDRVLFVNPVPIKGIERLGALAMANPDIPFLVADNWILEKVWRAWVKQRFGGLRNIEWRPATDDVRGLYGDARLLLMPSVWEEAYGRTATEAQLNGLPVLASRRGALPDTVGAGGLVVDLHAPDETWTAALRKLYFDVVAWNEMSEAALAHSRMQVYAANNGVDDALALLAMHSAAEHPR
ncbi:MAG TPA: glycosyltransferase [Alphaproteobacteria bacterium]